MNKQAARLVIPSIISRAVSSGCFFVMISSCASLNPLPPASSQNFKKIVNEYAEQMKRVDAFLAPYYDVEDLLGEFGDYPSPQFFERQKHILLRARQRLRGIDPAELSDEERITYALLNEDLEVGIQQLKFPDELLAFNQMGNRLHSYLDDSSQDLTTFPFDSVRHYQAFIQRSEGFINYVNAQIALLRRGVRKGIVLSCIVGKNAIRSYQDGLEPDVEKNPFWRPIQFMPKSFSDVDRRELQQSFRRMIQERLVPGFKKFDQFYRKEYLPHCRKSFGMGALPNGKRWYALRILANTNEALEPSKIYHMGLLEIRRIQAEMLKIKKQMEIAGTWKDFLKSLTQNPNYFFQTPQQMFRAFEQVKIQTEARIPQCFSLIPRSDFRIVETSNPDDAAGSYNNPTDNIPYGRFVVNTKNLRSVPRYGVTTLMLHETVPGHHFQLALQYEMKDRLPEYRRKIFSSNAFVEGWALYSEYLGNEMGLFLDPLQRLGHLNDDMLRAVRLVVDVGIHAYGWPQRKAIAFMSRYLASDAKDIETEVNRYSVWPAQALGYKVGQLKILELRRLVERELGPKFDLKRFHELVIGKGTVSLSVLESEVRRWLDQQRKNPRN